MKQHSYASAYKHGFSNGAITGKSCNPFNNKLQTMLHNAYNQGFKEGLFDYKFYTPTKAALAAHIRCYDV